MSPKLSKIRKVLRTKIPQKTVTTRDCQVERSEMISERNEVTVLSEVRALWLWSVSFTRRTYSLVLSSAALGVLFGFCAWPHHTTPSHCALDILRTSPGKVNDVKSFTPLPEVLVDLLLLNIITRYLKWTNTHKTTHNIDILLLYSSKANTFCVITLQT